MPILVEKISNNNPIFMETKYGYFIYGQYYKKGSYSPVPFKFLGLSCNKNIPITNRSFPIANVNSPIDPFLGSHYIESTTEPDVYYIITPNVEYRENIYDNSFKYFYCLKIYETENEFKIIAKQTIGGYTSSSSSEKYSNFKYISQDEKYIYLTQSQPYSSYNEYRYTYRINKSDCSGNTIDSSSYLSGCFGQIIHEDDNMIISTGHYYYQNSYNSTNHEISVLTKSSSPRYSFSCTYNTSNRQSLVRTDPEDTSQYRFNNDGVRRDDGDNINTLTYANYYLVNNTHCINDPSEICKKHRAVFNKENGDVETYRIFFGYQNSGGSDDILVNIARFTHDIQGIKNLIGSGSNLSSGTSGSYVTVKTCEITNKESLEFKEWRNVVKSPGTNYMVCDASKYENDDNTYLVLNFRQNSALCYRGNSGSDTNRKKQSLVVFKIDRDDTSKLTFISHYAEDIHGHMGLYPLNEEYQILATSGGWRLLKFDYTLGVFKPITFRDADSSGWLCMDKEGILYSTVDNYAALEFFRIQNGPYRPEAYFKNKNLSMDGQAEIKDEVIVKCKDFIGNNINSTVHVMLDGENIKFDGNNEKEIDVQISSIEDSKSLPITVTGSGTFGVKCYAKELKSTD